MGDALDRAIEAGKTGDVRNLTISFAVLCDKVAAAKKAGRPILTAWLPGSLISLPRISPSQP